MPKVRMLVPRDGHQAHDVVDVSEDDARRYLYFAEAEIVVEAPETASQKPAARTAAAPSAKRVTRKRKP